MAAQAEVRLVRYSPAELVEAVRAGRLRYPTPGHPSTADVARVLDGIRRGFPVTPLLLWQDPVDRVLWLLDGGAVVTALLAAYGETERSARDEPLLFDADTGEVLAWGQRPPDTHQTIDLPALLGAGDPEAHLVEHRLVGEHADRARALLDALRLPMIAAQVTELPQADLPALFGRLTMRQGVQSGELGRVVGPAPGPSAAFFAWGPRPRSMVSAAREGLDHDVPDDEVWRLLRVAEGLDPDVPYDPAARESDLPDNGRHAVWAVRNAVFTMRGWFWFGVGRLLPDPAMVGVVARFHRVFPEVDDAVPPLLRRWAWRAALGESEIDLSSEALAVIRDDPADSVLRLLAATPPPSPEPPGRDPVDLASRRGRGVMMGMASLHPRDLTTGELIDVEQSRIQQILREAPAEPANLMFHDHVYRAGLRSVLEAVLATRDPVLLATHGIDETGVALLHARDDEGFLARRAALLDRVVPEFWSRRIEAAAAHRRPVAMMFEDDRAG